MYKYSLLIHCGFVLCLLLTANIGDHVVKRSSNQLQKALCDNLTHAVIAGISWTVVCFHFRYSNTFLALLEILLCTMIGSFIDLDHFLMAQSIHLQDATNLKNRPPLHCSTIPLIFFGLVLFSSYLFQVEWQQKIVSIIFTAFASHHIRDATRRGLWFYPFGATGPLSKFVYISLTCAIPYFTCFMVTPFKNNTLRNPHSDFIV